MFYKLNYLQITFNIFPEQFNFFNKQSNKTSEILFELKEDTLINTLSVIALKLN